MERISTRRITTIFLIILFIFAIAMMQKNRISADVEESTTVNFSINIAGKSHKFSMAKYMDPAQTDNPKYILSEKNGLSVKKISIENLGQDAMLCSKSLIYSPDNTPMICLKATSGVHSENLVLIKYTQNGFSIVDTMINNKPSAIFSDLPRFAFIDYNSDGFDDIIADQRDYDKVPMVDTVSYYFKNSKDGFILDKKEEKQEVVK